MSVSDSHLWAVLRIGHDTSMRGEGISLIEALRRTDYRRLRESFNVKDLQRLLCADSALIEQWIAYSEDKRTGGWWLRPEPPAIGRTFAPHADIQFETIEEATAEYVLRELDYWSNLR